MAVNVASIFYVNLFQRFYLGTVLLLVLVLYSCDKHHISSRRRCLRESSLKLDMVLNLVRLLGCDQVPASRHTIKPTDFDPVSLLIGDS